MMPTTQTFLQKLFALFTGALLGYFWGWIWGWSLFDPNSDLWALLAAVGALLGLVAGITLLVWRNRGALASASIGLYLGWILRTLLFGDIPGGWGLLLLCLGAVAGWIAGARLCRPAEAKQNTITALIVALYAGFFGGFLVDVVLLDLLLGVVKSHSILSQAPAVLGCGVLGGIVAARRQAKKASP
jgi:hypothetical protein